MRPRFKNKAVSLSRDYFYRNYFKLNAFIKTQRDTEQSFNVRSFLADHGFRNHHGTPKTCVPTCFLKRHQFGGISNFIETRPTNKFKVIFEDAWLGNGWCRVSIFHIHTLGRQVTFWYIGWNYKFLRKNFLSTPTMHLPTHIFNRKN